MINSSTIIKISIFLKKIQKILLIELPKNNIKSHKIIYIEQQKLLNLYYNLKFSEYLNEYYY